MSIINHQNNFGTNLTSNQTAGVTTTPLNSIPSVAAPFYIALDATNINSKYEVVLVTSKTATHINHAATTYAHTTAEEVRMVVPAAELDASLDNSTIGWFAIPTGVTLAYSSADDPTYVVTTSSDLRTYVQVGDRVKFTNNSTTFYGLVTAIDATTMTLYGGTDYDVANSAITAVYFSHLKSPVGFPLDPLKWTIAATDTSMRTQATPSQNTWYNAGSITLAVPIGSWKLSLLANVDIDDASASTPQIRVTLSTANNSESDATMTGAAHVVLNAGTRQGLSVYREKNVLLASKTSHYVNIMTPTASVDNINIRGDIGTTVIRAVSAYL